MGEAHKHDVWDGGGGRIGEKIVSLEWAGFNNKTYKLKRYLIYNKRFENLLGAQIPFIHVYTPILKSAKNITLKLTNNDKFLNYAAMPFCTFTNALKRTLKRWHYFYSRFLESLL